MPNAMNKPLVVQGEIQSEKFFANSHSEKYAVRTFLESIKKGQHSALTLWEITSKDHSSGVSDCYLPFSCCASCCAMSTSFRRCSPAFAPISPILSSASSAPLRLVKSLSSPLCLSWRRPISPCMAATMKPALLSESSLTASIPDTTSCGTLTVKSWDLAFLFVEAISSIPWFVCVSVYTQMIHKKALTCVSYKSKVKHTLSTGITQQDHRNSEAPDCANSSEASNHNPNHRSKHYG